MNPYKLQEICDVIDQHLKQTKELSKVLREQLNPKGMKSVDMGTCMKNLCDSLDIAYRSNTRIWNWGKDNEAKIDSWRKGSHTEEL